MKNLTLQDLKSLPTPERTATWNPISHYDVVSVMEEQIQKSTLAIVSHHIETTKDSHKLFGRLIFDSEENTRFMMGYRNSTNKSMALGFCSGQHVTVCSNMMFSGSYITFRKHTASISLLDVATLTKTALDILPKEKASFDNRMNSYLKVALSDEAFKSVIWDLMVANVLKPSEFNRYLDCVEQERDLNRGQTLATVHNAYTRLYREKPTSHIMYYTPQLTAITDSYV